MGTITDLDNDYNYNDLTIFFQTNLNKFYVVFCVSKIIIQKIMEILFINYNIFLKSLYSFFI